MIHDPLLFKQIRNIPIAVIKQKVSEASRIDISKMTIPNHYPESRKREYVNARQISMCLSRKYSKFSLAQIGMAHGERDHATVLHACKTINNFLDIKDETITEDYNLSIDLLKEWYTNKHEEITGISFKRKTELIKHWIKCKVPLHIRLRKLQEFGNVCPECGQIKPLKK